MSEEEFVEVRIVWSDAEQLPVYRANTFFAQNEFDVEGRANGIVLTLGNVMPPMVMGSGEMEAALRNLGAVSVKALGRYSMGVDHAKQLIQHLQNQIASVEGGAVA